MMSSVYDMSLVEFLSSIKWADADEEFYKEMAAVFGSAGFKVKQ